jgi:hypothetical protein
MRKIVDMVCRINSFCSAAARDFRSKIDGISGGEFIPGETIIKLYYWKRIDGYVTIPGDSLFKVAPDGYTLEVVG